MSVAVATGAVFEIVTLPELTAVPVEDPSLGVARQYTELPEEKYVPVSVDVVGAMSVLLTYQAYVYEIASPSASVAVGAHVNVEASYAVVGVRLTEEMTGAELVTVAVFDATATPLTVPSFGVTVQYTVLPLDRPDAERVEDVPEAREPLTYQA